MGKKQLANISITRETEASDSTQTGTAILETIINHWNETLMSVSPKEHLDSAPKLGLAIPETNTKTINRFVAKVKGVLEEIGIEYLFFDDIYTFNTSRTSENRRWEDTQYPAMRSVPIPQKHTAYWRVGVTLLHDDVFMLWRKRTVAEYVEDGTVYPRELWQS